MTDPTYDTNWQPATGESLAAALLKVRQDLHDDAMASRTLAELQKAIERHDLSLVRIEAIIRGFEQGGPGCVDWCVNQGRQHE